MPFTKVVYYAARNHHLTGWLNIAELRRELQNTKTPCQPAEGPKVHSTTCLALDNTPL